MTTPLSVIFEGDVTLLTGSDTAQYGSGDLTVARSGTFLGTEVATNASTANLVNYGGFGQIGDAYLNQILNVSGGSFLNALNVNTNLGATNITGSNGINASVGSTIYLSANSGNLTLASNLSAILQGSAAATNAIQVTALNAAGGIQLLSGTSTGLINAATGSGGFTVGASGGSVNTTSFGASSNFIVNSNGTSQALNIGLTGAFDNGVNITSTGTNASVPAIKIESLNTSGNIKIANADGLGAGSILLTSGSGGITALTNTGGSISLTSQGAGSSFTVNSDAANQNLVLQTLGAFSSGIVLQSESTNNSSGAIRLLSQSATGSIVISNTTGSTGKIELNGASGGLQLSSTGGNVNSTSIGASSTYKVISTGSGQNLNIVQSGSVASQLLIQSAGTGTDALRLETTTSAGGISMFAKGKIDIQSTDNVNGINIGTIHSGVVNIGKAGSYTSIFGNLDVKGDITMIATAIATYEDNILIVNNAPTGISDGGLAVKRYQTANDTSLGTVVNPTNGNPPGYETGTAQAGSATTITLASGASAVDDFYNGAWLKLTSGTGSGQVRKIKSYVGSTKVATIYDTADQTGVLGSPTPTEGLDFTTSPDATSVYSIYHSTYVMNIWNESADEFAYVYATQDSDILFDFKYSGGTTGNYANLHINNLTANSVTANTINNTTTDLVFTVTLTDNSTTGVTMAGLTLNYGVYIVLVRPTTASSGTRPSAVFIIGRNDSSVFGTSNRLLSVKGSAGNSQLDIQWASGAFPTLRYNPSPGVGGSTGYTLRCITI